jgi:hypothetical protein
VSYASLLVHRVDVQRATVGNIDGLDTYDWNTVATGIHCRLDLQYIRPGVDPQWTPEAGRPTDRTGVAFFPAHSNIRSGDRLIVRKGPQGTFLAEGAVDDAQDRHGYSHHLEVGVREVPGPRAAGSQTG